MLNRTCGYCGCGVCIFLPFNEMSRDLVVGIWHHGFLHDWSVGARLAASCQWDGDEVAVV
jgi:hypothetical protein